MALAKVGDFERMLKTPFYSYFGIYGRNLALPLHHIIIEKCNLLMYSMALLGMCKIQIR